MKTNNDRIVLKTVMSLLLLLLTGTAYAQLRVDKFEARPMDNTANATDTRVDDGNGKFCALIKVKTPPVGLDKFYFYVGAFGVKKTVIKGDEIWVYVPRDVESISVSHERFSGTEFEFPEHLRDGSTYELLLNVGGGRYVNIFTQGSEGARVTVDDVEIGNSPVYNHYLTFGRHHLSAVKGKFEGRSELEVVEGEGLQPVFIPLIDQSSHFGEVVIDVDDPNAEIYFQSKRQAAGTWRTELREGTYEVVTKKADCRDAVTRFTVVAGQENKVKADAPVPFTGSLQLYVRPRATQVVYDNNQPFNQTEARTLPVGLHQFQFTRSGYVAQEREIRIAKDALTTDTIELEAINYLKSKWAFYFGAGYTMSSLGGLTGYVGGVYVGVDLQLSYTLGMSSSKDVYMYKTTSEGHELLSGNTYKMNAMAVRLGYQLRLIPRLGITPQVGYQQQMLTATATRGTGKYADGAKASSFTLGAKILAVPAHRVYLFLTPEYAVELSKDETFNKAAQAANFNVGGFSVSAGVLVNIGK